MTNMKHIIFISLLISVSISLIILIIYIKNNYFNNDYFENPKTPSDKTKLYISLFLNNLNEVVAKLTNPDIKYESKRIDLNKYSDTLL